jgi:AbrB family looped-hinge helix DNA binding protein
MRARVSSKGQIVLPAELREQDGIESGEEFDVQRVARGEYLLIRRAPRSNEGVLDWLLSCPEKDFFVPVASESSDTL